MKNPVLIILLLFAFQLSFAQSEKLLKGKISDKEHPLQGVDVINFTNQKSTVTNSDGVFYILAKANDILLFYRKNYIQRKVILNPKNITPDGLEIELVVKPIELEEVVIDNNQTMRFEVTQGGIDEMRLAKAQSQAKVVGINDGSIPNGIDFVRLGKDSYKLMKKLFKSDSKVSKNNLKTAFKKYVNAHIDQDYFIRYLKLEAKEIPPFVDFCSADPKSKTIMENANVLAVMDFLGAKRTEFQKVLSLVK